MSSGSFMAKPTGVSDIQILSSAYKAAPLKKCLHLRSISLGMSDAASATNADNLSRYSLAMIRYISDRRVVAVPVDYL